MFPQFPQFPDISLVSLVSQSLTASVGPVSDCYQRPWRHQQTLAASGQSARQQPAQQDLCCYHGTGTVVTRHTASEHQVSQTPQTSSTPPPPPPPSPPPPARGISSSSAPSLSSLSPVQLLLVIVDDQPQPPDCQQASTPINVYIGEEESIGQRILLAHCW